MLTELTITNFAIIDELHLRFTSGFNVLTGETGAGKSIIIDTVSLLLGGRADTTLIRAGADRAQVEGIFRLDAGLHAQINLILEREGLESVATNNGKMALEKLEDPKNNIGIIISDIEMPEMDGLDLLKAVKKDYPDLPVILITGKGGRFNRNDVEDAGADGYITKPFKNTDIILTVKSSLGL